MAVDGLASAYCASYPMDITTATSAGIGFRARPGRRQRLKTLIGDMRQLHSLRGKLSLVYARAGSGNRVRAMVKWSQTHANAPVGHDDVQRLYDRVTRGCSRQAHAHVFRRIAENYLARAETAQLATLRQSLGSATRGPVPWVMLAPRTDPARQAWAGFSAMLDGELARRALLPALRQVVQALPARADGHALDLACARLATALHRTGGERAGAGLLATALGQLRHVELQLLATHLAPRQVASPQSMTAPIMERDRAVGPDAPARGQCAIARALCHLRASPDIWRQRLDLIGALQAAVNRTVCERLDYFVHTTSRLIDFQLDQGRHPQAVYDLAAGSLMKSLDSVGYAGVLAPEGTATLAPRLIAAALLGKPLKDVLAFAGSLDIRTLTKLVSAMESAAPEYAGATALLGKVRDELARRYLDRLIACLGELEIHHVGDQRWPIAQGLKTLAMAVEAWEKDCHPGGLSIPPRVQQDLRATIQRTVHRLSAPSGSPTDPHGDPETSAAHHQSAAILDHACIRTLCSSEVECLRIAERRLGQYGLSLDKRALAAVAHERAAPHIEMAADHLADVAQALARDSSDPAHVMRALRDAAESAALACAECASFVDMNADDAMRVCVDVAAVAWRRFSDHHASRRRDAEAALAQSGYILHDGLNDAASALIQELDANPPPNGDWRDRLESHAVSRLRLASQLMEALQAASIPAREDAQRPGSSVAGSDAFIDAWTPELRRAVTNHFGVKYDPVRGRCSLVMTRAQHERFAAGLLDDELKAKTIAQYEISGPGGATVVEIDEQLLVDGITRITSQFSVCGVDRDGAYLPYASSSALAGEDSHVPGVERGLLALRKLAGPDTAALTTYLTQTAAAGFLYGLYKLGEEGPVRMDDGLTVMPGGMAYTRTDIKRMADGSYAVRLNPYWYRLDTATAFDGSAVRLDPVRSFASLASDVRLTPLGQGLWRQEVAGPLMIRHHMVRLES